MCKALGPLLSISQAANKASAGRGLIWSVGSPSVFIGCWENVIPCSCRMGASASRLHAVPGHVAPHGGSHYGRLLPQGQLGALSREGQQGDVSYIYVLTQSWDWHPSHLLCWFIAGHRSYPHSRGGVIPGVNLGLYAQSLC